MWPTREEYDRWIENYLRPRYPELVSRYTALLDLAGDAKRTGILRDGDVRTILECAHDKKTVLGENAAALLGELSVRFTNAEHAIREMIAHRQVHIRINALVAISNETPGTLREDVLRIALTDRSASVKALAASKIIGFRLRHLIPELDAAIARETTSKAREALQHARNLLHDGYDVCPFDDSQVSVNCVIPGGGVSVTLISKDELEKKGIKPILDRLGVTSETALAASRTR